MGPSKRELLRIIERERAQHRLELAGLLDRLAAKDGHPWTPAPADMTPTPESEPQTWQASPEQHYPIG